VKLRQDIKIDVLESLLKTVQESMFEFNKTLVEIESNQAKSDDLLRALDAIELDPATAGKLPDETPRAEEIRTTTQKWMEEKRRTERPPDQNIPTTSRGDRQDQGC